MLQIHTINNLKKFLLCLVAGAVLFTAGSASSAEKSGHGEAGLLATYHRNSARLEKSGFGLPLFLESFERDDKVQVDVYGIFLYPFGSVADVLKIPANWCDIVPLHLNVKSCTYKKIPDSWLLTFFIGRKGYQPPEDTRQVMFQYRIIAQRQGYLDMILTAAAGPFGTKDHRMRFEALPLDGGRTFVHVSYEYRDSAALRFAEKAYFATLARNKVGFTVTGKDRNGNPVYIGGPRGAIERNAVRYYFAIQAFMDTLCYAEKSRFNQRISGWYDLTNHYRKQLFEMNKQDYLTLKTKERTNQLLLQRELGTGRQ